MSDEVEKGELAEVHCPNCDHRLDKLINDIWKDPSVKEALRDGRSACDIMVLDCPKCGRWGYYNQGSHFWCRFCDQGFEHTEDWDPISLDDTVTATTDGYDNMTLPRENTH